MQVDESVRTLRPDRAAPLDRRLRRRSRSTRRSRRCAPASRSSSPRRAGCSTSSARRSPTSARSRSSSSTRRTGCSTWASCRTSSGSSRCCPARRQNLLFSATFSDDIRRLSGTILRDPETVEVAPRNTAAEAVEQLVYPVDRDRKEALLAHLIRERRPAPGARLHADQARRHAGSPTRLDREGIDAVAIHSDRSQPERTRALEGFKSGEIRVLVATDVAARGLDIEDLPVVVNFELPWNPQDYIHRIGRTGRAGATGEAISLVCIDEVDLLRGIQRMLKHGDPVDGRGRLRPRSQRRAAAARRCGPGTPGSEASITRIASRSAGRVGSGAAGAELGVEPGRRGRSGSEPRRRARRRPAARP